MKKTLIVSIFFGLMASYGAHADQHATILQCDDQNIFETPLMIRVDQNHASASGSFSGVGDAIFDIHDSHLSVSRRAGGELEIGGTEFLLRLRKLNLGSLNTYAGTLRLRSSDQEKMPYSGDVTCKVNH